MATTPVLNEIGGDRLLPDRIADEIRDSIIHGRFQPGDRLMEAELAEQLGVSTVPVREAMLHLEREGLVYSLPRRGRYVREFSERDVNDLNRVRALLDELACAMIREQGGASEALQRQLRQDIDDLAAAATAKDRDLSSELDFRFHDHIHAGTGSAVLQGLWEALRPRLHLLYHWRPAPQDPEARLADAIARHTAVLEDLRKAGPSTAQ